MSGFRKFSKQEENDLYDFIDDTLVLRVGTTGIEYLTKPVQDLKGLVEQFIVTDQFNSLKLSKALIIHHEVCQ